jgi:hypothetical protein
VQTLAEQLDGKTVVTSDHGEMLKWKHGHGYGIYTEELRKVPWMVLDYEQRRTTTAEKPIETDEIIDSAVDTQHTALGYK